MKREGLTKAYRAFAMFGSFGFIMAASILVGFFIGSYLDKQFDTEPWFLIIFLFLAIIGAFIELFKTFQRFMAINAKDKEKREDLH